MSATPITDTAIANGEGDAYLTLQCVMQCSRILEAENAALRYVVERAAQWDVENTDNADLAALGAYARAALAKNPEQTTNDLVTLERAIAYCEGQAMADSAENPEYDKGVAACVRMLEDMLPYPQSSEQSSQGGG
jgi:hypothetical protein